MTTEIVEDYVQEAIAAVSAWELPEDQFVEAVNMQARLMAGLGVEEPDPYTSIAVHAHLHA
jgi:hypothetical protein